MNLSRVEPWLGSRISQAVRLGYITKGAYIVAKAAEKGRRGVKEQCCQIFE